MSEEKPKEGVKTENDHINLKVAGQDGSVVQFKIKRHTPLSKLMKAYCERQGLAIRQIRFRFDGQPINETDTPAQLEMEDEDTIDPPQEQDWTIIITQPFLLVPPQAQHPLYRPSLEGSGKIEKNTVVLCELGAVQRDLLSLWSHFYLLETDLNRISVMPSLILALFFLRGLKVIATGTDTWRHCADLLPLDLLSFVLERDPSKLVPGVHLKQAGGVRGVHFSSPHPSMSFLSSQLLVDCDLFPREFSFVVTLKVSRVANKRNEYIFSLMESKRAKMKMIENGRENFSERDTESEQHGPHEKKRNEEAGRIILGLRFSRKRLHFVYKGHGGVTEHLEFEGAQLADNQWHTLVFVVSSHHVRLTVDCNSPLEIVPSRPLPSDLNIQGARFHIGSRGRWKGLYSGLLRQLVLVPGSDATHYVCPSSDPQLAALSVPPLLSDLPLKGREGDNHVTPYETEERVSVGLQRLCSEQLQGQLWFNPLKKGLYLCDGTTWVAVLEDHKRLDYVLEHQVLTTSSETHDVEVFQVPDLGLMAAMAHRSPTSGSALYLWSHTGFQLYQNISTYEALAWRQFSIGKKIYLVVSNSGEGTDKHNKKSETDFSVIYKWSRRRKKFVQFQTLKTHCARDWEAFNINQQTYLAVANHRKGENNHTIDSVIYKWNKLTKSFDVHQTLPTSGAYDWEYFSVGPYHFLVVANAFDGVTTSVDSVIYIWVNESFQVFQTIKTFCATDWEMFQIGSRVFLVVANGHRLHGNGPSQYAINSTIYELDMSGQVFVRFQDIITYSAVDWEFFSLGEEYFLVVANSFNGESYSLNSILYRWQGYEGFVPVHWLPTIGCSDWEFFSSKGESYLIYSSAKAPLSKVFKLKTY
ncbi:thrombospondin-type laminin G domain and EAR repeat-containing protein-like isoform X2 [Xyrichtys novacula]|uniref:Thrombospondin-type laminin G domain and EAR repeat-containing protein-like isoform X2 n=1 Tax=Xyrichtys novacula TaxID=13765 RepID=A0AAV1GIK8_XYRNO|nr:thrombospondin-type laminin G domain and EAR repeat-containing protein-like isoform X2 [Xyrichtys novacula]